MATSGRINTGGGNNSYFYAQWQLAGQSIPGNYSAINWQAGINTAGGAYWQTNAVRIDGGSIAGVGYGNGTWSNIGGPYNGNGDHHLRTGSFNLGHDSNGTKSFGYDINGYLWQTGNFTASGSDSLPTIPRHAVITAASGNQNDEFVNPWLEFSNPAGTAVDVYFDLPSLGVGGIAPRSNVGSRYTWTLTNGERNAIRAAMANVQSTTLRYVIHDTLGGADSWSFLDYTISIINGNPTFVAGNISYKDDDSGIVAITTDDQKIVQNQSDLVAAFTAATPLKSATMANYKVTLGSDVRNFSTAQTAIDYGLVNLAVDTPLVIEATDSRGLKTTAQVTVAILPWSAPRATITAGRVNNFEDDTEFTANVTIDSVNSKNAIESLAIRYKKTTDGSYTDDTMTSGVLKHETLDKAYEWNVQIVITDKFDTTTYNLLITKGIPIMFFDTAMLSIGVGMFPTQDESLEIAPTYMTEITKLIFPVGFTMLTSVNTNPGTLDQFAGQTWAAHGTTTVDSVTLYYFTRTA